MKDERARAESWGPGRRRILLSLLFFVCGFAVIATAVHVALRDPLRMHADIRSEKLVILDEWQGRAYSAIFGSSHMHSGFDPRAFDRSLAGSELATRSLNLAVAGGSQTEQRAIALEFLRRLQPPPRNSTGDARASRACMVMLELNAGANFTTDHLAHPRAINLYDWPTTRFAMQLTSPGMPRTQRYGRQAYALLAMGMHYLNVGMLSSQIFAPPIDLAALAYETAQDRRGVYAGLEARGDVRATIEAQIRDAHGAGKMSQGELEPGNYGLVQELLAASPVTHVQMVYVVSPKLSDLNDSHVYPASLEVHSQTVPIINLAQPDRFPQIYKAAYWHDDAHLDPSGAEVVTKILANELKAWFGAHGAPAPCGS